MNKNRGKKTIYTSRNKFEFDSSDDDSSDDYQNALMSSLMALSNKNQREYKSDSEEDDAKKPTDMRIDFVRNILDGTKLKPMVDFNNVNTESSSIIRLNKKIMDVRELFTSMNVKLKYLKSGTTGHTFKAISKIDKNVAFAVKVCAYPKDGYGGMHNMSRPENTELRMLSELSNFVIKKYTPHFVLPIGTLNTPITNFIKVPKTMINLDDEKNEMYKKFIEKYYKGEYEDFVSVLISEWCNGGDLLDYIRKNYSSMRLRDWVVIIFQILFTLARVQQDFPAFRHNDMKANNILVELTDIKRNRPDCRYCYQLNNTRFIIPNINLQIKIWDFDFACIDGYIENNKVNSDWTKKLNITKRENKYYDMHYFFNTLITKRFFPQFYDGGAPDEIIDFIHRIIPEKFRGNGKRLNKHCKIYVDDNGCRKYVNEKGRIQVDTEYTTPAKVITEDPLFEKYRF